MQQAVEAGDQVVVGVNRFRDEATATPQIQRIDAEGERRQIERLRQVRAERDDAAGEPRSKRSRQRRPVTAT